MLSFTCEGSRVAAVRRNTDWRRVVLREHSQFGVIGRKVPPRLMLQANPSSDPED
jgi:hypothetical protein